jgi:hypothetical protein
MYNERYTSHETTRVEEGRVGDRQLNFVGQRYFRLEPVG